jgi:hypothetical protein
VITKRVPVCIAAPLDEEAPRPGVPRALAIKVFHEGTLRLGKFAKLAGLSHEGIVECISRRSAFRP